MLWNLQDLTLSQTFAIPSNCMKLSLFWLIWINKIGFSASLASVHCILCPLSMDFHSTVHFFKVIYPFPLKILWYFLIPNTFPERKHFSLFLTIFYFPNLLHLNIQIQERQMFCILRNMVFTIQIPMSFIFLEFF